MLLDHYLEYRRVELLHLLEEAPEAPLRDWLRTLSGALAQLAQRHPIPLGPDERFGAQQRCAPLIADALRRHFPGKTDAQLLILAEQLVWTADGLLEGALRYGRTPPHEVGGGILAAWRGLVGDLPGRH